MQACLLSAEVEEKVELIQLMVTGVEYHQVLLYPTVHATSCHMPRCNAGSLSFITCTADQAECCHRWPADVQYPKIKAQLDSRRVRIDDESYGGGKQLAVFSS